jgi:hypothetical protein
MHGEHYSPGKFLKCQKYGSPEALEKKKNQLSAIIDGGESFRTINFWNYLRR